MWGRGECQREVPKAWQSAEHLTTLMYYLRLGDSSLVSNLGSSCSMALVLCKPALQTSALQASSCSLALMLCKPGRRNDALRSGSWSLALVPWLLQTACVDVADKLGPISGIQTAAE